MASTEIDVTIEIPKGTVVKCEHDHKTNELVVSRILHGSNYYFFNYGYLRNTLSGDGDPLDVVVFCDESLPYNCRVRCKVLGYLYTKDDDGDDEKLITVPIDSIDPNSIGINDVSDVHDWKIKRLRDFFSNYKTLEGKECVVGELYGVPQAIDVIDNAYKRHNFPVHDSSSKVKEE